MCDFIPNPSDTLTMVATLRIPGMKARTFTVMHGQMLPVVGRVNYGLWSLRWRKALPSDLRSS